MAPTSQLNKQTKISLGLLIAIASLLGSGIAFGWSVVNDRFDNQDQRLDKLEDAYVNVYGDVRQMRGQVDYIYRKEKNQDSQDKN